MVSLLSDGLVEKEKKEIPLKATTSLQNFVELRLTWGKKKRHTYKAPDLPPVPSIIRRQDTNTTSKPMNIYNGMRPFEMSHRSKTVRARDTKQIVLYQREAWVVTNGIRAYTQPEVWPMWTLGPKK